MLAPVSSDDVSLEKCTCNVGERPNPDFPATGEATGEQTLSLSELARGTGRTMHWVQVRLIALGLTIPSLPSCIRGGELYPASVLHELQRVSGFVSSHELARQLGRNSSWVERRMKAHQLEPLRLSCGTYWPADVVTVLKDVDPSLLSASDITRALADTGRGCFWVQKQLAAYREVAVFCGKRPYYPRHVLFELHIAASSVTIREICRTIKRSRWWICKQVLDLPDYRVVHTGKFARYNVSVIDILRDKGCI